MLTRTTIGFSPVPSLLPLETSRWKTLISRRRPAWKEVWKGWLLNWAHNGFLRKATSISVIFLCFLSWSSPDRASPWEGSVEWTPRICLWCFITLFYNCMRKKLNMVQVGANIRSEVRSRGICCWEEQEGSHTKAIVKTMKVLESSNKQIPMRWTLRTKVIPKLPYLSPKPPPRNYGVPSLKLWRVLKRQGYGLLEDPHSIYQSAASSSLSFYHQRAQTSW